MRSGWITEAKRTQEFERQAAQYVGARHVAAVPSGTTALAIALQAAGVGAGDEVLVPAFTMMGTASAVRQAGATPVLVDIEPQTLGMSPEAAAKAMTSRTRAIVPVDMNARAPRLEALQALARSRGVALVEDAAQALGSRHAGRHLGTFGALGIISLSTPKIITTGQGGLVLTDSDDLNDRVRRLKDHGRLDRSEDHHPEAGFNYKFTDIQAAIGLAQMAKLPARVEHKKAMYGWYREELAAVSGVRWVDTDLSECTPWFVDILVDDPVAVQGSLKTDGIESRLFYRPLHQHPVFAGQGPFPCAEEMARQGLWLPSSSFLGRSDVARVAAAIRTALGH
jgi:perosamine synthetase